MSVVSLFEVYGLVALFLACALAFWRGGTQERRLAVVIAVAWIGSVVVDNDGSRTIQWAIFIVDMILAIWLLSEAILGRKLWPAFAAGAQVMIVMTHVAFFTDARIVHEAFFSAYYVWSYVVLACLAVGSLLAARSRSRKTA